MNWTASFAIGFGGVLLILGWRNTHNQVWKGLGGTITDRPASGSTNKIDVNPNQNGASGAFNGGAFGEGPLKNAARIDAQKWGIDPKLFASQIDAESSFDPNAISSAGAIGIAQFMPSTAASIGVNPRDPYQSLNGAAMLMGRYMATYGDPDKALAAYNAGPGVVNNATRYGQSWESYIPSETRSYISKIHGGV